MERAPEVMAQPVQVVRGDVRAHRPVQAAQRCAMDASRFGHFVQGNAPLLAESQISELFLELESNHVQMVFA